MASESENNLQLEIGHVLFIDIVGYSKLLIEEQKERLGQLTKIVLGTAQVRDSTDEQLVRLPTGDGMALVFRHSAEEPARCALEIAEALRKHPEIPVRMGIHSGPVSEVSDVNGRTNIAGAGINMAQRVMDCGDADHILLSKHVAEDLEQYGHWKAQLHGLGECEVKHGVRLSVVNLYCDGIGNPKLPHKLRVARKREARIRWTAIAGTLLLLAAILAGFQFIQRKSRQSPSAAPEKSIAVLPFENLSEEKANAYFAEGIQDEILTKLAKVGELKVISRTSTAHYASSPQNLPEIAQQLGVANVLEGSVQKISNAVHINVQLIRASNDEHIWAESYDHQLDDVFGVEAEVAGAIAEQLRAKLTGAEQKAISQKPTQNAAAYDAYLRGLSIQHNEYGFVAEKKIAAAFAQAVKIDPDFALAWANLAIARSPLYLYDIDPETNSAAAIREAADRAMALQPELAESWAAQAAYRYRVARDFSGALQAYREAYKRFPNSSRILEEMAVVETRLGRWDAGESDLSKAIELDPRSPSLLGVMATEFLGRLRRFSEAHQYLDRVLKISPGDQWAYASKANLFQYEGRLDDAAREFARFPADSTDDVVVAGRVDLLIWEHKFDKAIAVIEHRINSLVAGKSLDEWDKIFLTDLGYCQEWSGQTAEAKATFARVAHEIKPTQDAVVPRKGFGMPIFLGLAYAGLGEKETALEQAHRAVEEYADDSWVKPDAELAFAHIEARFGDADSAIAAIPHLLEMPGGITKAELQFDPFWDPLRNDPRFQKLCENKQP